MTWPVCMTGIQMNYSSLCWFSANVNLLSTVCANIVMASSRSDLSDFLLRKGLKLKKKPKKTPNKLNKQKWWERSQGHPGSSTELCWLMAKRYQWFFAVQCLVITPPVWVTHPALPGCRCQDRILPVGQVFPFAALFKSSMAVGLPRHQVWAKLETRTHIHKCRVHASEVVTIAKLSAVQMTIK